MWNCEDTVKLLENEGERSMISTACLGVDAIGVYIDALKAQGFASSTWRQREKRLRSLGKPLDECTHEDILRTIPTHLKAATRRQYFNALRYGCLDMLRQGLITQDPTVGLRLPKPGRSMPRPFTPAEQMVLLAMPGRERLWTVLGMFAGFRASDIVKVEYRHLEAREYGWVLRVPDGKGGVDATIPAHDSVVAALSQYSETVGPIWPILPDTMSVSWSAAARAVGVAGRFHRCRHTYGTRLYATTKDIAVTSRLMRHANVATTMIYTEISAEAEFAAVSGL